LATPVAVGGEADVGGQLLHVEHAAQAGELHLAGGRDGHAPVTGGDHLVGGDVRMGVALGPGGETTDEVVGRLVGQQGGARVRQRHLHPPPPPGDLRLAQGGQDPDGAEQPGRQVGDRHPGLHLVVGVGPGDRQDAGVGLHHEVEGRPRRPARRVAVPGDDAVHEAGVAVVEDVVAETHLLEGAGQEVLQQTSASSTRR
jgi:hypothetical protein